MAVSLLSVLPTVVASVSAVTFASTTGGVSKARLVSAAVLAVTVAVVPSRVAATVVEGGPATTTISLGSAGTADAFLDSLGVNVHWTYLDTAYGSRYDEVRDKLLALGIRHVRDEASERIDELARAGIRTTLLTTPRGWTAEAVRERVRQHNRERPAIVAVEGSNEPDLFWGPLGISYRGAGFPEGPFLWQQDLYRSLKADPETAAVPVIGPSLGRAVGASGPQVSAWAGLGRYADFGNFHPYAFNGNPLGRGLTYGGLENFHFQGNHPSVLLAADDAGRAAYADIYPDMPMVATEVGYPTGPGRTAEVLQAKYLVRTYLENFRLGVSRTFLYELLDAVEPVDDTSPHSGFGLMRSDASERPAYHAVRRLVAAVRDGAGAAGAAGAAGVQRCEGDGRIGLTVHGTERYPDPSRLHALVLSRPQGALTVLLWHEVPGEDARSRPRLPLAVDALSVEVRAGCRIRPEALDLVSGAPVEARSDDEGRGLDLAVGDSPIVIQIGD